MFLDFVLRFSPERSTDPRPRFRGLLMESTREGKGDLTFYYTERSRVLLNTQTTPSWKLWALGEIWGYRNRSGSGLEEIGSDLDNDDFRPEELNGHWVLLGRNRLNRTWHIWTNRLGTYHAYCLADGRTTRLSSSFRDVAAMCSQRDLDWLGLTGFFSFGFFPQDRTYYTKVRILRPASEYVFGERGQPLQQRRYWEWWYRPDRARSYRDTVREFADLFGCVLAEQTTQGTINIPVSGGLDSRSTVAFLTSPPSPHRSPWTSLSFYSYGYSEDSIETEIAQRIARVRKFPLQQMVLQPYLFDRMELMESSVEGFQDITQCRQAAVVDRLGKEADYLLAAHWGDVWLDALQPSLAQVTRGDQGLVELMLHKFSKKGSQWLQQNLNLPFSGKEVSEVLVKMLGDELALIQGVDEPSFRVKALKTDQWSFRWTIASLRMFQPGCFPRLPFYDTRMVDFFCTVSSSYVAERRLQVDYLKLYAPDLARVKWEAYNTSLYFYRYHNSLLIPQRALRKALRLLRGKTPIDANWRIQLLGPEGVRGAEEWLLRRGLTIHEFVSPGKIRELLNDLVECPTSESGYVASMLLTFSAWLEDQAA